VEELAKKMQEYLKMTEEIDFTEFAQYYQDVMSFLQKEYDNLDKDKLITSLGICQLIAANAQTRSLKKDADSKKLKKFAEKSRFWADSIEYRLGKQFGIMPSEVEEAVAALWGD